MKLFSEFRLCWGVTPATESSPTPLRQGVVAPLKGAGNNRASSRSSGGRSMKVNSSAHWKPALSAISEDSVVSDLGSRKIERTVRSQNQKKASEKGRSSAIARSPSHGDDYRNDSMLVALPAFSPTPFLF